MLWSQICLSHPEAQPFKIEVEVPEGETPKEFIHIDYGEQQENHVLFQLVAVDKETYQAFYVRVQIWHGDKIAWQLGDPNLQLSTRIQSALLRLGTYTTEEDKGSVVEKAALVLERVADDLEAKKMWENHGNT